MERVARWAPLLDNPEEGVVVVALFLVLACGSLFLAHVENLLFWRARAALCTKDAGWVCEGHYRGLCANPLEICGSSQMSAKVY